MRLKIDHATTFSYDGIISEAYTEVRLRPRDDGGQRCLGFQLQIEPRADIALHKDHASNDVQSFDVLASHSKLVVTAASEVLTSDQFQDDGGQITLLEHYDYLQPTYLTVCTPEIETLARSQAAASRHQAPSEIAANLLQAVHYSLRYERGATEVDTPAGDALLLGRGVCQDYTHIMLAACRALGMPARYVSGYLYSPTAHPSSQATHAWLDVYIAGRWVSLDPTHNTPQTAHHVRLAVGRDYTDAPPTRGVYTGLAHETLSVAVHVRPA